MADNLDSRAASFSLKRSHGEISQPESNGLTAPPTPHKRMKARGGSQIQKVQNGSSSGDNPKVALAAPQGHNANGSLSAAATNTASIPSPVAARTVSPMSWNSNAKAKIRVSLQRQPTGVMNPQPEDPSSLPAGLPNSSADEAVTRTSDPPELQVSMPEEMVGWESLPRPRRKWDPYQMAQAQNRCLFIGNLPAATSRKQVTLIFNGFDMTQLKVGTMPGEKRCYAFCVFKNSNDASRAAEQAKGRVFPDGGKLFVKLDKGAEAAKTPLSAETNESSESKLELGKVPAPGSVLDEHDVVMLERAPVTRANNRSGVFEEGKTYLFELPPSSSSSFSLTAKDSPAGNDVVVNIKDDSDYESGEVTPSNPAELQLDTNAGEHQSNTDDPPSANWYVDTSHIGEDAMMAYANSKALDDVSKILVRKI
ncbi:MAG: hypothetical protein Q9183_005080 [Haloplaca sp. 2 TL-2023]